MSAALPTPTNPLVPARPERTLSFARMIDVKYAMEHTPPKIRFVLHGLARRYAGGLIAQGSAGKSHLLLGIGCEVATGGAYGEIGLVAQDLAPSKVLYLSAEEDEDVLHDRLDRVAGHLKPDVREMVYENFEVGSALGTTPALMSRHLDPNETVIAEIIDYLKGYAAVFFDPLRKWHDGDENQSADMTVMTKIFDRIALGADCAVLFAHHVGKGATRGGSADQADAARGSGAITDNIRLQLNLSKLNETQLTEYGIGKNDASWYVAMDFTKLNHAAPEGTRVLHRRADGTLYRDEIVENAQEIGRVKPRRSKIVSIAPERKQNNTKEDDAWTIG
ncbi:MAG: AAA family ATPase [Metallibacterium sp.]